MYRRQGGKSVLQGVLSGAYAGGRREIDVTRLPRATKKRLADALVGRSEPTPLLYHRADATRAPATWGVLVALLSFIALTAVGFGNPNHAWALAPPIALVPWSIAGALFGAALLAVARRRARVTGDRLPEGRWLFPLDVVEVHGGVPQRLTVTPLGDARDVSVEPVGNGVHLVLGFEGGEALRFPLRNASDGEVAMLRLEHSQRLLEDLTYKVDIDRALSTDVFFDLRVDDSWKQFAPDPRGKAVRARPSTLPLAAALVAGLALGASGYLLRNRLSDRALYQRALRQGTVAALDVYIAKGKRHVDEARAAQVQILEQQAEAKLRQERQERAELALEPKSVEQMKATCIVKLRERGAPNHPEVTRMMVDIAEHASIDPVTMRMWFDGDFKDRKEIYSLEDNLGPTLSTFADAFIRVFSETCPAAVIHLVHDDLRMIPNVPGPHIVIGFGITWPGKTWTVDAVDGGTMKVHAMQFVFNVTLTPKDGEPMRFRLTMPPPDAPKMTTRARSLFVIPAPHVEGFFDERVYAAMTARAFDQLYDELYTHFFAGDPRVPLRGEASAR